MLGSFSIDLCETREVQEIKLDKYCSEKGLANESILNKGLYWFLSDIWATSLLNFEEELNEMKYFNIFRTICKDNERITATV